MKPEKHSLLDSARPRSQRWGPVIVSLAAFLIILSLLYLINETKLPNNWLILALVAIMISAGAFLLTRQIFHFKEERFKIERRLKETERLSANANKRLQAVFQLNQVIVETNEEHEIVDQILKISVELSGAVGASLVPLDAHGQPMTAINYGDLPSQVFDAWIEYLASPAIRHQCGNCSNHETLIANCPLLQASYLEMMSPSPPVEIYCLPLRRGQREFGILNIYLPAGHSLDKDTQTFLRSLVDETALALEGVRIQQREIEALRQLQTVLRKTDLADLLQGLIRNVRETLAADFVLLEVNGKGDHTRQISLSVGDFNPNDRAFIDGIIQAVKISEEPVSLGDITGETDSAHSLRALISAPLLPPDSEALGVITAGFTQKKALTKRQLILLTTVAGQAALVVQNTWLMAEVEYQTMIAERTRLAREIHDGLAQTLGFLKLQTAQLKKFMSQGDLEHLQDGLDTSYDALVEAYEDARQAIDGLRIVPSQDGLASWLEQTAEEFQDNTGLRVTLVGLDHKHDLAPEVEAQLIRIVQEALSNTRKHAEAQQVRVSCYVDGRDMILEIYDDGRGFSPQDVPRPSRHGMRGMRERADLIGAEFQIISRPQEGTTVRVMLPLIIGETTP